MTKETTMHLFSRFVKVSPTNELDARAVVSKECYAEWHRTRRKPPKNAPHAFRKAITGHCRGDNGLEPFPPKIEAAVLKVLRKQKVWKCFEGTAFNIGQRGYQTLGHWERKYKAQREMAELTSSKKTDFVRPVMKEASTQTMQTEVLPSFPFSFVQPSRQGPMPNAIFLNNPLMNVSRKLPAAYGLGSPSIYSMMMSTNLAIPNVSLLEHQGLLQAALQDNATTGLFPAKRQKLSYDYNTKQRE